MEKKVRNVAMKLCRASVCVCVYKEAREVVAFRGICISLPWGLTSPEGASEQGAVPRHVLGGEVSLAVCKTYSVVLSEGTCLAFQQTLT